MVVHFCKTPFQGDKCGSCLYVLHLKPLAIVPPTFWRTISRIPFRVHTHQGNVREFLFFSRSGNFIFCQGKMNFCQNVREFYISVLKWKKGTDFLFQNNFKYKRQSIFFHFVSPHLPGLMLFSMAWQVYIVKTIFCLTRFMRFRENFSACCSKLYLNKRKENLL